VTASEPAVPDEMNDVGHYPAGFVHVAECRLQLLPSGILQNVRQVGQPELVLQTILQESDLLRGKLKAQFAWLREHDEHTQGIACLVSFEDRRDDPRQAETCVLASDEEAALTAAEDVQKFPRIVRQPIR